MQKKILYINSGLINDNSGGGIGAKRIFDSLEKATKKNKYDFKVISLDEDIKNRIQLDFYKTKYKDILSRLFGHSSYIYLYWNKIKNRVIKFNPDIIFLDGSRLGSFAKYIKNDLNNDAKIIGIFTNVELDYLKAYALKFNFLFSKLFQMIESIGVYRDEKAMVRNMDKGLFLTNRDKERINEIYFFDSEYEILPICVPKFNFSLNKKNKYDLNLIFLGSLWYGSNIDALKWFLKNVWQGILELDYNINFIIGGSNPSSDFLNFINDFKNVNVYPNFKKKSEIVPSNSLFVSPIRTGSGMKVKVAEALSMGLSIIASDETLVGYEEALNDDLNNQIIIKANKPIDYIKFIEQFIENCNYEKNKYIAKKLHEKYYSLGRVEKQLKKIVK